LPAMLAASAATTITMYAQKRGWVIGEVEVHADYGRASVRRRVVLDVRLPNDLSDDQQRRLEAVARACPTRRALEAGFVFEKRVAEPSTTARARSR